MHTRDSAFENARGGGPVRARFGQKDGELRPEMLPVGPRRGASVPEGHRRIHFPCGLLGFPNRRDFALVEWDHPNYSGLKLLESLTERELSFVVLPLTPGNELIETDDLEAACVGRGIAPRDLLVLLLISARRNGNKLTISANVRAPLLIDASRAKGVQHLLENEKYQVRHALPL